VNVQFAILPQAAFPAVQVAFFERSDRKQVNGTFIPCVGVLPLDSQCRDSQSDGNSSARTGRAEWRFAGVARVLRCERKTLLQPRSKLKPTSMQVDTDLLRLVNRKVGRFKRCSLLFFVP